MERQDLNTKGGFSPGRKLSPVAGWNEEGSRDIYWSRSLLQTCKSSTDR